MTEYQNLKPNSKLNSLYLAEEKWVNVLLVNVGTSSSFAELLMDIQDRFFSSPSGSTGSHKTTN